MKIIEKQYYLDIKDLCLDIAQKNDYTFFRGTKMPFLYPSLVPNKNKLDIIHLITIEKKLLKAFEIIYPHEFECDEITKDWLYRIRAREHELASRLIDWTNTFYIALDFATRYTSSRGKYVYLWILTMKENEIVHYSDFRKHPIKRITSSIMLNSVKLEKNNELAPHRQLVQGGSFLIQPPNLLTTKLNKQSKFMDRLICLKIPSNQAKNIRRDIRKFEGVDVDKDMMIEKVNCIDSRCKVLNEKLLYSVNDKVNSYLKF